MQTAALMWCRDVAGQRPCRPLEGASPASVFAAVEAAALRPLPVRPFVLATWSTPKVGPDIHAKVGKTIYSVPWRLIGQQIDARETWTMVQFFHKGQLVATHPRKDKGKRTDQSHYPPEKIAFRMRTPVWCRTRAAEVGPSCVTVVAGLLEVNALHHLRAAQCIVGLAAKHGTARLDAACAKAITAGDPTYRTIKGILAVGTEADPPAPVTGDGGAAAHLHGPTQLFANVMAPHTTNAADADPSATHSDCGTHGDREHADASNEVA